MPLSGDSEKWTSCVLVNLRLTILSSEMTNLVPHPRQPRAPQPRPSGRAAASAPRRRGADPDGRRGHPVQQGVRGPDRARKGTDARHGRMARAAARGRPRFSRTASPPTSVDRIETLLARANRLTEAGHEHAGDRADRGREDRRPRDRLGRVRGAAPGLSRPGLAPGMGEVHEAIELLDPGPRARGGPELLGRRARRPAVPARRPPATSSRASRRRSRSSTRRSSSQSGPALPCDLLRSKILNWRSRCRRRQRDFEAAREDVERALELADGLDDKRMTAHVYFQASLIAEREGHWVAARGYAERARDLYEEVEDGDRRRTPAQQPRRRELRSASPRTQSKYLKEAF